MFTLSVVVSFLLCASTSHGQEQTTVSLLDSLNLHKGLSEKIGNFSIELLYFTTLLEEMSMNVIMSPVTAWSLLAVIAEGAQGNTQKEIGKVLRIVPSRKLENRAEFKSIFQWLQVSTNTVDLERFNAIFVDAKNLPLRDFVEVAAQYGSKMVMANFSDPADTANSINTAIDRVTHGRISTIVSDEDISSSKMLMTSVLYFKGQWTSPFNASSTTKRPFYSSTGQIIGEVNMMYNRYTYPFANIKALQARVIELPYGKENRLSMLIMLPNPGVHLKDMFRNFNNITMDLVFSELKAAIEQFGEDEVDCMIPRFKIESKLDLTDSLKLMGMIDLFDESRASLPLISRLPLHATKIIHKAEIEVTEEGTTASAVSVAEFANRISILKFEVNRPFCYLIVEKTTNSIAFGGIYHIPSLY